MKVKIKLSELKKYQKAPTGTGYNFPDILKVEAEPVEKHKDLFHNFEHELSKKAKMDCQTCSNPVEEDNECKCSCNPYCGCSCHKPVEEYECPILNCYKHKPVGEPRIKLKGATSWERQSVEEPKCCMGGCGDFNCKHCNAVEEPKINPIRKGNYNRLASMGLKDTADKIQEILERVNTKN